MMNPTGILAWEIRAKLATAIAFVALAVGQAPAKPVRTVSDPVEIEIRPAGEQKPAAATPTPPPQPSPWGLAVHGLRTRLSVWPRSASAGRRVWAHLDVRNVSDAPIDVAWVGNLGRLVSIRRITPHGRASVARKDKRPIGRHAHSQTLQGGLQMEAWSVRLDREFEIAAPGVYRLRWEQIPEERYAARGRVPPPSNAVTLRITPPGAAPKPIRWLDGHAWSKSPAGLQTRLTAGSRRFAAGSPIRLRLEIRNTAQRPRRYYDTTGIVNGGVTVAAVGGGGLPFLGALVGTASRGTEIRPGQAAILDEFDISDYYYLRKPGKYVLRYEGETALGEKFSPVPPSPLFEIEVAPDPAAEADGDPVGKLLAGMPKGWLIWGSPNAPWPWTHVRQPGRNFSRVPCRAVRFVHKSYQFKAPPGKQGVEPVTVWLATRRARVEPWQPMPTGERFNQPSQYLGRTRHYHVYLHVPQSAAKAWPTVRTDVKKMLPLIPRTSDQPQSKGRRSGAIRPDAALTEA